MKTTAKPRGKRQGGLPALGAALFLATTMSWAAEEPAPLVIRISTSLVQLDAVVTDRDGRHVTDLGPGDFEVVQNGLPRPVTHVTYVRTTAAGVAPSETATSAAAAPAKAPRTLVFLVDSLHLSQQAMNSTRKLVASAPAWGLGDGDLVAVSDTRHIAQAGLKFVSNSAAVADAAGALRFNVSYQGSPGDVLANRSTVTPHSDAMETSHLSAANAASSLRTLTDCIAALRQLPGRKAIVFFSEGFVAKPASAEAGAQLAYDTRGMLEGLYRDTNVEAALRRVIDMANRASVVLYAVDPSGLNTSGLNAAGTAAFNDPPTLPQALARGTRDRETRYAGLLDLAEPTGGLVVSGTNNLDGGLERILNDQSGYYLVGYEPDEKTFTRTKNVAEFHKVKIKVRRDGLRVRSRQGFYGVTDEAVEKAVPVPKS